MKTWFPICAVLAAALGMLRLHAQSKEVRSRFEIAQSQELSASEQIHVVRDTSDNRCFVVWTNKGPDGRIVSSSIGPTVECQPSNVR
jgi:hypothetical protein